MGKYNVSGQDTSTAATTIVSTGQPASALKRLKFFYLSQGSDATADNAIETVFQRATAMGTSTAITPQLLDAADGAASAVSGQAHSAEPTYTANAIMLSFFGHQRATLQWYAPPGGEIIVPVTNTNGIGCQVITVTTAYNIGVVMQHEE